MRDAGLLRRAGVPGRVRPADERAREPARTFGCVPKVRAPARRGAYGAVGPPDVGWSRPLPEGAEPTGLTVSARTRLDAAGRSLPLRFLLFLLRLFPEARARASGSGRAATAGRFMTGT